MTDKIFHWGTTFPYALQVVTVSLLPFTFWEKVIIGAILVVFTVISHWLAISYGEYVRVKKSFIPPKGTSIVRIVYYDKDDSRLEVEELRNVNEILIK